MVSSLFLVAIDVAAAKTYWNLKSKTEIQIHLWNWREANQQFIDEFLTTIWQLFIRHTVNWMHVSSTVRTEINAIAGMKLRWNWNASNNISVFTRIVSSSHWLPTFTKPILFIQTNSATQSFASGVLVTCAALFQHGNCWFVIIEEPV